MANIITIPEGAIVEDIDLYIDKQTNLQMINVRQYDSGMRYIRASVWDNGDLYPMLATDIICLTATKPDRNPLFNQAGIDGEGRIIYEMTEQTTSAYGVFIAEFRIYNTKEVNGETVNTLKSTYDFKINVAKSNVQDTTIISTPEFNALTDAMASVGDLVADVSNAIENSNVATANAINATNNANTKATLANEKAILAEEKATQANNAALLANEKASLADTATSNANAAATNANTATTDAINATSNANTATANAQNAADYANDVATILDNETLKIFKPAVSTYADLLTTYPIPENGWTVTVIDEVVSYRYNGTEWINLGVISSVDTATDTTLGIVKGGGNINIGIDGTLNVPSIGDINQLETESKELVGAINEVNAKPSVSTAEDVTYGESNVKIALDDHSSQLADIALIPKGLIKDNIVDNSAVINSAIISSAETGCTVKIPDGTYYIDTANKIIMQSKATLELSKNTILKAIPSDQGNLNNELSDWGSIILASECDNFAIKGGTLEGDRSEHIGTTGEWNFGLLLLNCTNFIIENVTSINHWGDGIYLGHNYFTQSPIINDNGRFINCKADNNRRNGIAITSGKNIILIDPITNNTNGTSPQAGIDIEAEGYNPMLENITIENPKTVSNVGVGISLSIKKLNNKSVGINIHNHKDNGSLGGFAVYHDTDTKIGGEINIINPSWINNQYGALSIFGYGITNPLINISQPYFKNSNMAAMANVQYGSFIRLTGNVNYTCGNIMIKEPIFIDDRAEPKCYCLLIANKTSDETTTAIFDKISFIDPIELCYTINRPINVNGYGIQILDRKETMTYNDSGTSITITTDQLYPKRTTLNVGTFMRYTLPEAIPIGFEIEIVVLKDVITYILPTNCIIAPLTNTVGAEINSSTIGSSIKIKKISKNTFIVTSMVGNWQKSL